MKNQSPVRFIGSEKTSRSRAWNAQSTVNFYIDGDPDARTPGALMPWPGELEYPSCIALAGAGLVQRGIGLHRGVLFAVTGEVLYEIRDNGDAYTVGAIPGTERVAFASDGLVLILLTHGRVYTVSK
jgi:hypothetical protein